MQADTAVLAGIIATELLGHAPLETTRAHIPSARRTARKASTGCPQTRNRRPVSGLQALSVAHTPIVKPLNER